MNDNAINEKMLSVIVPAYNVEKYLNQCINSFIGCKDALDDLEIIIVNDGSTDNTPQLAKEFKIQYPESIVLVNKENGGHGSAINAGVEVATGRYIKVVDGDDWVCSNGLVELINYIKNNVEYPDVIVNPFERINEVTNDVELMNFPEFDVKNRYSIFEINKKKRYLEMHATTFRTDVFQKNAIKIDEKLFYVDVEYILYPIPYVNKIVFLSNVLYEYRLGNVGQSVNVANMIKNRNMHKRVIMSLLQYYSCNEKMFSSEQKKYYLFRLSLMASAQINIYCIMEDCKLAKEEMIFFINEYWDYKKQKGIKIKTDIDVNRKLVFLKWTRFIFFDWVSKYYKKKTL